MTILANLLAQAEPTTEVQMSPLDWAISFAFLAAAIAVWGIAVRRVGNGLPIVEPVPHRVVPWSGLMTLGVVVLFLVASDLAGAIVIAQKARDAGISFEQAAKIKVQTEPIYMTRFLMSLTISRLAFVGLSAWLLLSATPAARDDIGMPRFNIRRDLVPGLAGFLAIVPAILFIQYILLRLTKGTPEHQIFDAWRNNPSTELLLWSTLTAVVTAPLSEEFLFRGVIQGWLEKLFTPPPGWDAESAANSDLPPDMPPAAAEAAAANLDRPPAGPGRGIWPVAITSALFALVHLGQGIAPVPLFVFSLGVGYLYRQTHSIWPGVIVHFLLNAYSMTVLVLSK